MCVSKNLNLKVKQCLLNLKDESFPNVVHITINQQILYLKCYLIE